MNVKSLMIKKNISDKDNQIFDKLLKLKKPNKK